MIISVIIPVYNVAKYVIECLNSVLQQKDKEIEIIIVNDGSTDSSLKLCQDWVKRNGDIRIQLLSQENKGLSEARNAGLKAAVGEYVIFLDSDDMLAPEAILELRRYISEYPMADIFYFDALIKDEMQDGTEKAIYNRKEKVSSKIMDAREYFAKYYLDPLIISSCLCLYKAEFIKNNRLEFPAGKLHEDNVFSFQAIMKAGKVMYIPHDFYIRRYREQSITMIPVTEKHVMDLVYAYTENIRFARKIEKDTELYTAIVFFLYQGINNILYMIMDIETKKEPIKNMFHDFIDFLVLEGPWKYTFTYFEIKSQLQRYIQKYPWLYPEDMPDEAEKQRKEQLYDKLYKRLPFSDIRSVGIYGAGNHTENLLDWYRKRGGELKAKLYVIDSRKESFRQKYKGYDVINICDAGEYVDCIVISSFIYHAEMKLLCEQNIGKKNIEIIDFYENEKIAIF